MTANIVKAIRSRARSGYPFDMERVFVLIQRVLPVLIDNALIAQLKKIKV